MSSIKAWPHMTIVAVLVAAIAGVGGYLWMKHEPTASASELPYAARIQRLNGEVAYCDDRAGTDANAQWTSAMTNQPLSEGDRIYTRDKSRASLAFTGRNFAVLDPNTSLDIVALDDRRTQLALRDGSATFDVGYLASNELFEVATPYGAVDFDQPGLYNVGFDQNGSVLVSVLSGLARVVGLAGSGEINKGEVLTLVGQTAAEVALARLNRDDAGYYVDDYYRYQYGDSYDGRYINYDTYLSDPYYYDPYQRNVSYKYASAYIPGINDLDSYGDWQSVQGYGYAWRPRVESNWVPYQQGQWVNSYPYGPTWVSSEPWGYAPYHYGRWANVGNQWYWIPDGVNSTPAYSPALVAFVSSNDSNLIGWVPLGPGDSYAPRYYDDNWQPYYLTRTNLVPATLINLIVPGAVTMVAVDAWGRPIDPRNIRRIDQGGLASLRKTLDPLTFTPLRNAVVHSAWGRGKIDLPPGIAKKLWNTPVFFGTDIRESKFRKNLAKYMRVERVSDQAKNQKFKVKDQRDESQQVSRLGKDDRKGNRDEEKGTGGPDKSDIKTQKQSQGTYNPGKQQSQGVANPGKQQSQGVSKQESKQKPPAKQGGGDNGGSGKGQGSGKGKGKP